MEVWQLEQAFALDKLELAERAEMQPSAGEVLLEMRAASLNYRDLLTVRGAYGPRNTLPLIPLSDGVGEVVEIGAGVDRLAVGDRVAPMFFPSWIGGEPAPAKLRTTLGGPLDGVLRRRLCISAEAVARVPEHLSDAEAACLPCAGLTAWSALATLGRVGPGDVVLVQGTGGVALFALQFAKLAGAEVILTSSRDDKLARGRQLGADAVINYRATPEWDKEVKARTGGEGCDHVVELGGAETLGRSIRAVRIGGTISLIGVLSGADATFALPLVVMRNLRLQGVTVGSRDGFEAMCRAVAAHHLHPVIDRVFHFKDAPKAFAAFAEGRHFGKICIGY
jgi:NADPH:quinone reductase-like Zn-dependent oxidoreductase